MTPNEVFAKRLRNARIMKGFSMDELVAAMGNSISKMSISKYEKCQMAPNSSVIIALSKALEQPVDYFFKPFSIHIDSIKFRKLKSKLSSKQEKCIKENIFNLIERYSAIEEACNSAIQFEFPFKTRISLNDEVKKAASQLRCFWKLGNSGIANVIDTLEEHGIKVLEIDAESSFDGLSAIVNDSYPVIVLNKSFNSERKRFTALHELGHIIIPFKSSVTEKEEENLCSLFASEMLIEESVFRSIFGEKRSRISYQELYSIQMQYGISCDAMMHKAKDCGIISEQHYTSYWIKKRKDSDFREKLDNSIYPKEESSRFIRLVYRALSCELITISKAASLLNQTVDYVRGDLSPIF